MKKHVPQFVVIATLGVLLAACGGGGGGDRAEGVEPGPPASGGSVPAPAPELPAAPGYADAARIFASITDASLPDDNRAVVDFQVTDEAGNAIVDLASDNVRFVIAKLQGSPLGNFTGEWQSYINKIELPGVGIGTEARLQANSESDGELTNNQDGSYSYRYAIDIGNLDTGILDQAESEGLDLSVERSRTHRVAIQFSGAANPVNPWYDWVPASGEPASFSMNISATVNCNGCHDQLALHGGGRIEVEYCVTCHNPGSTDANSTNTVAMKNMIHKIHMGSNLPSVQAGTPYVIYGYRDSEHDYSHVNYPQDIRNCQNCHVGTGTTNDLFPNVQLTSQGDNWNEFPSRSSCGSCHDDVDWESHRGGQPDDSRCASCHSEGGRAGSVASSHALLARDEAANYEAEVLNVENSGPGQAPAVDIIVTDPNTGAAYDILNDAPFTNEGAALNVKLAWSTTDYTNTDNGADNASAISQSALTTATPNGDGSFHVQFEQALPSVSGSGGAIIDGHPNVDVDGDGSPDSIPMTDAHAFFSIDEADATAVPRRDSAEIGLCLSCHQNLVLHGGNRTDNLQSCVTCHNPRNTDRGVREDAATPPTDGKQEESIDMKTMIHAIHAAAFRENPLQVVGFRGFNTHVYDEEHVQYPGKLNNCVACHGDTGWGLPLASGVLATSVDTGSNRQDPSDDTVVSAATAVCSSCHDGEASRGHMETNGGSFATSQQAIDDGEVVEQCDICHGEGRSADVGVVHDL